MFQKVFVIFFIQVGQQLWEGKIKNICGKCCLAVAVHVWVVWGRLLPMPIGYSSPPIIPHTHTHTHTRTHTSSKVIMVCLQNLHLYWPFTDLALLTELCLARVINLGSGGATSISMLNVIHVIGRWVGF